MAELAILPRCSAAELRGRLLGRRRGKIRLSLSPPPGNAQKDTLNGNFAALGDNWALRRHVIIPATAAKTGALLKLLEFMDSAGERETSITSERASEFGELFFFRTTLMALFFDDPTNPCRLLGLALTAKTNDRCSRGNDRVEKMVDQSAFSPYSRILMRNYKIYLLLENS